MDHINPGFVLSGMTRASLIEVPSITFQVIDISDTNPQNIVSLAEAFVKCQGKYYPELSIDQGRIFISEIRHASFESVYDSKPHKGNQNSEMFIYLRSLQGHRGDG